MSGETLKETSMISRECWRARQDSNLRPTDQKSYPAIKQQLSTTHNNNKFNVLKETVGCRLLWKTAIICGQVAFFWPFPSLYSITKLPIPAKCHNRPHYQPFRGMVMQKYSTHKSTSGFTLIELLILIAIIREKEAPKSRLFASNQHTVGCGVPYNYI